MPGEVEVDKEEGKADESTAPPEVTAPAPPRPVVGIIYPPPEVRSILSHSLSRGVHVKQLRVAARYGRVFTYGKRTDVTASKSQFWQKP